MWKDNKDPVKQIFTILTVVCVALAIMVIGLGVKVAPLPSNTSIPEDEPIPVQLETNLKVIETFRIGPNTLHTVVYCPTGRTFILNNKGGMMLDLGVKTECNTGP